MPLAIPARIPRPRDILTSRSAVRADRVDEANDVIAKLFCAHELAPLDAGVTMSLRSAHAGPVGLDLLDYGQGVRISPVGLGDFHLVQIPLRGHARMQVGSRVVESSPHRATVPPIDRDFVMEWKDDTPHLIVYVDREELSRVASAMWNLDDTSHLQFGPSLELDTPAGQSFLRSVLELHDLMDGPTTPFPELTRRLARELMITRLLIVADSSIGRALGSWSSPVPTGAGERLYRRFMSVAEQTPTEDLTSIELARLLDEIGRAHV